MSKSKLFQITILATLLILLVLPQIVDARGLVPCGGHGEPRCNLCHIFIMIQTFLNGVGLVVAGWAVIFIVIGGIMLLTSAGSPEKTSQGKKVISYAIIGIIVAFGGWLIINTVMNELVNPKAMPWPWNKIECVPTEGVEPNGEEGDKNYCVCEIPRYSLKPDKLSKDIKATKLENKEACEQLCVGGNSGSYCPNSSLTDLSSEDYDLYCVNQSTIETKQVCRLYLGDAGGGFGCRLGTECYDSDNACYDDALTTYLNKCYLDDYVLCDYHLKGKSTFCPTGAQKTLCGNSSDKYVLYKWREEKYYNPADKPIGSYNAYECSQGAYGNSKYYCRLNCQRGQYDICHEEEEDWCGEVKDSFSCFGSFTCKNMTTSQTGDACYALKQFLNCMGSKLTSAPAGAKVISSISDNSKYKCFDIAYWDEKGQCSGSTDSCTGTCCGHSKYSLHYGAKPNNTDCRKCSWAVDFANEQYYQNLKNVAEVCADELNYGKVDIINEGNHVHIELEGVAKDLRCM